MRGIGTVLNTAGVLAGGALGMLLKGGMPGRMQEILMQGCGLATMFIGGAGVFSGMFVVAGTGLETRGSMLLILSLVLGGVLGEWIDIERRMDALGERIKAAVHAQSDHQFVDGFVNTSLIICIGAMAIVGSLQDGISGDYSTLATKAVLDLILVCVFTSSYGKGAIFSAIPIFVYQGVITLVAALAGSFIPDGVIQDLSFVGSALIFCVGVNVAFGKKFRVGNLLPALFLVPVLDLMAGYVPILG